MMWKHRHTYYLVMSQRHPTALEPRPKWIKESVATGEDRFRQRKRKMQMAWGAQQPDKIRIYCM